MDRRSNREIDRLLKRGRRKGWKALQKTIRAAVDGGPKELLEALNFVLEGPSVRSQTAWIIFTRVGPSVEIPVYNWSRRQLPIDPTTVGDRSGVLLVGQRALREMADRTIREATPRCNSARECLKVAIYGLWIIVEAFKKALDAPPGSPLYEVGVRLSKGALKYNKKAFIEEYSRDCELAVDMLLTFWAAPEVWLQRLRKCKYSKCRKPYFLDRSAGRHARFCKDAHRVASSRSARARR